MFSGGRSRRRGNNPFVNTTGVAHHLIIATQPAGAVDGDAFTTQPVVYVVDSNDNIVASSTAEITAAKASGTGTIGGDTTKNAVNGVATFTDLEIVGTGNHTISFSASGLMGATSQTINVAAGGGGALPTIYWFSDFRHATGNNNPARQDGATQGSAKWNGGTPIDAQGSGLIVVNAVTEGLDLLGWPSTNALKVTAKNTNGTDQTFLRVFKGDLPIPGEGESIWYRVYVIHMQPLSQSHFATGPEYDEANHPIELGYTTNEDVSWHCETFTDTQWRIGHGVTAAANGFNNSRWYSPLINKGEVYRFESQFTRLTGLNFNLHCRLYNSAGILIADDDEFVNRSLGPGTLGSTPTLVLNAVANLGEWCAGLNGLGPVTGQGIIGYWWPSELYQYQGCFAVSYETWCGPYDPTNG